MIIFLDFDGVLCTGRQAHASGEMGTISGLDPVALMFLDRMCREHDCKLVISSDWRFHDSKRLFYALFAGHGYTHLGKAMHRAWKTPVMPHHTRGYEIERWLLDNEPDEDYIIFDDDDRMLDYQMCRLILTDSYNGMLMQNYIDAERLIKDSVLIKRSKAT